MDSSCKCCKLVEEILSTTQSLHNFYILLQAEALLYEYNTVLYASIKKIYSSYIAIIADSTSYQCSKNCKQKLQQLQEGLELKLNETDFK